MEINNLKENDNSIIINKWDDLNLDDTILRGIYAYGLEIPSIIQQKAILPILNGRDILAQAQSGTGKTATFCISALQLLYKNKNPNLPSILIISPTRELTEQTANVLKSIGSMVPNLSVLTLYGGITCFDKIKDNIICGCPGKINDYITRGLIDPTNLQLIILDEIDELLSFGFKEQLQHIFKNMPMQIQVAMFSATLDESIINIADNILINPIKIFVKNENLTLEGITQYYVELENDIQKFKTIMHIYNDISISQCIIYCNSVKRVINLTNMLLNDNFPVCAIHSDMSKQERNDAIMQFRNGMFRILISSNITARGIDIQQVSVVINYDIPKDNATYLHRIGRTGRWGRKGTAINLITHFDKYKITELEKYFVCQIKEMPNNFANAFL